MNAHVNQLCKSASFSLRRVGQVRRYLDNATTEKLTHALITSKLDQCNSLLYGLPDKEISQIQRIQNSAARLVTRTKRQEHITPVLRKLNWLPIKKRIIYKILLLTYKSLKRLAPDYFRDLLYLYVPTRILDLDQNISSVSLESEQTTMVDVLSLHVHLSTGTNYPPILNRQLL